MCSSSTNTTASRMRAKSASNKLSLLILNKCVSSADTFTKYAKVEEHIPLYIILAYNKHMQMDVFFFYQYYCIQNACQKREVSI